MKGRVPHAPGLRVGVLILSYAQETETLLWPWGSAFLTFSCYRRLPLLGTARARKKRREKLEYMHANPVKRGLVKNPAHWIWSSYSFYEKNEVGLVKVDFVD